MKPQVLTMSAFGSYGGVTEIDFERADGGLFLITGDTGAGKTTIFDALSFALFGSPSGASREGSMLRSQYAPEGVETWVELQFEDKGEIYRIRRSPAYTRLSKRKNKEGEYTAASVPAKAVLVLPDGTEMSGRIRPIDEKIREIVGVDRDQFSQVAMIAQGEYLRLLHASSRERKEIFSRIFHTGIYGRIQQKLREADKKLYVKLQDNEIQCEEAIRQVVVVEESDLETQDRGGNNTEVWKELRESWQNCEAELLDFIKKMLESSRIQEKEARNQEETLIQTVSAGRQRLEQIKQQNARIQEAEEAGQRCKYLETQADRWKKEAERLRLHELARPLANQEEELRLAERELETERKRQSRLWGQRQAFTDQMQQMEQRYQEAQACCESRLPGLETAIHRMQEALPLYTKREMLQQEYCQWERQRKKADRQLKATESAQEQCRAQEELLRKQESEVLTARISLAECRGRREQEENRRLLLSELEQEFQKESERKDTLQRCQSVLRERVAAYQKAEQAYQQLSRRFLAMQAGILAEKLEEGKPCPVCGSVTHPNPCRMGEKPIREGQVESAKRAREAADQMQQETAAQCQEIRVLLESGKRQQAEIWKKLCAGTEESDSADEAEYRRLEEFFGESGRLQREISQSEERIQELKRRERIYAAQIDGEETLDRKKRENQKEQMELEKRLEEQREELKQAELEARTRKEKLEEMSQRLEWENLDALQAELQACKAEQETLSQTVLEAGKKVQERREKCKEMEGTLASVKEHLSRQESQCRSRKSAFEAELQERKFADAEAYHSALLLEEEARALREGLEAYREEVARAHAVAEQLRKNVEGLHQEPEEPIWQEIGKWEEEKKRWSEIHRESVSVRTHNESACASLTQYLREREQLVREKQQISELYQTADGKMSGSARIDFQTYMQRRYFRQMVQAANRRLRRMTRGAFELQCRELEELGKQGEVGLDLDVYSFVTDRVRDVKTLSGGESFMAALAMALGMADIIQNAAGSVKVDAMFIDEGFGSLDEESRIRSVQILKELSGGKRLVGIISHVSELKEEIGRKLVVEKENDGSRAHWEIED